MESCDDGWQHQEVRPAPATEVQADPARSVITRNNSPDVPFELSINPYRGCEHGCIYCYARPSHAYLNLSAGLDFETRLFYKADAVRCLESELQRPGYRCRPITLGANTDPYQPIERRLRVTRGIVEVLRRYRHPMSLITKGALIERDVDILADMADRRLASVLVSVTTLDPALKRTLEPRTASPQSRLGVIERLSTAGIPVGVLVAPVIPGVNDGEIESILAAVARSGARHAGYVLIRLPHEVKQLFREWLETHLPLKAARVMKLIRASRGGKDYDARFGHRMRGTGPYAALIEQRFNLACRHHGLNGGSRPELDTSQFAVPADATPQLVMDL